MCTRTVFGKAEIVLWRIAPEVFHLDVARSFVPYVWALPGGRRGWNSLDAAPLNPAATEIIYCPNSGALLYEG